MGTALVLSSLIVVCGFIAYTGDLLGRRLGKRRLSIFGLRPRHTAILCTIITGMVIAGMMLGVLMGASAGVRLAVIHGEWLVSQNRQYRRQRDELRRDLQKLGESNSSLEAKNRHIETENTYLANRNTSLSQQNDSLTGWVDKLKRVSQKLTSQVSKLRGSTEALAARNDHLKKDNRHLTAANRAAQTSLTARRAELKQARRELEETRRQLAQATHNLEQSRQDLSINRELIRTNLSDLQARQARVTWLEFQERRLAEKIERLAQSDVIVRDQEELARVTVAPGTPLEEVVAQVQDLLGRARQVAWERGARPKGQHPEAAYLVNGRMARAMGPTVEWPHSTEPDLVVAVVREMAHIRQDALPLALPVVLRAQAVSNTAKGEPVPMEVQLFPNLLAFRKGEEIASTTLDPSLTRGQMLEELSVLLQGQVRKASLGRQMLLGPQDGLGAARYDPLLEVADKVKRLGVTAKVGAVAARDIRSADPLALDFYVVPAQTPVAALTGQPPDEQR